MAESAALKQLRAWFAGQVVAVNHSETLSLLLSAESLKQIRGTAVCLLTELSQTSALSARVAAASYYHDNGFLKLVLDQSADEVAEIRIHVWGYDRISEGKEIGAQPARPSNIHNHSADFVSLVLTGAMREETFALTLEGRVPVLPIATESYACSSRHAEGHYSMTKNGSVVLEQKTVEIIQEGRLHAMGHRVLHRIMAVSIPTISLFAQSRRRTAGTSVYVPPSVGHVVAQNASPPLSTRNAAEAMQSLAAMLGRLGT